MYWSVAADKICLPDIILSAETKRMSIENLSRMILMHYSGGTVVFFVLFFYLGFMAHQNDFIHFESSES